MDPIKSADEAVIRRFLAALPRDTLARVLNDQIYSGEAGPLLDIPQSQPVRTGTRGRSAPVTPQLPPPPSANPPLAGGAMGGGQGSGASAAIPVTQPQHQGVQGPQVLRQRTIAAVKTPLSPVSSTDTIGELDTADWQVPDGEDVTELARSLASRLTIGDAAALPSGGGVPPPPQTPPRNGGAEGVGTPLRLPIAKSSPAGPSSPGGEWAATDQTGQVQKVKLVKGTRAVGVKATAQRVEKAGQYQETGAVPKRAKPQPIESGTQPDVGGRAKAGEHSVHGSMIATENVVVDCDDSAAQNVFCYLDRNTGLVNSQPSWYSAGSEHGWSLTNLIFMSPSQRGKNRSGTKQALFPRLSSQPLRQWALTFDKPYVEQTYDMVEAEHYMAGRVVDARKVGNQIRSAYDMDPRVAEVIGALLGKARARYDNMAFYLYFILIALQLDDYARRGIAPTARVRAAGAIENRDFSTQGVEAEVALDLAQGRIVIDAVVASDVIMETVAAVANGLPAFTVAPGANVAHHVLETLSAPVIPVAIYSAGAMPIQAHVSTTPEDYLVAATTLADYRNEMSDLARAMVRACTIINGRVHATNSGASAGYVFETALLERYKLSLPKPSDTNWMWHYLGLTPRSALDGKMLPEEMSTISNIGVERLQEMSVMIGALTSVATSALLHLNNVGGTEIGSAARPTRVDSSLNTWLKYYLDAKQKPQPLMMRSVCGFLARTTCIVIHPDCFRTRSWCNRTSQWAYTTGNGYEWDYSYSWCVPYPVDPLAVLPMFKVWPPFWGIIGLSPEVDVSAGLGRVMKPTLTTFWDDSANTTGYERAAHHSQPYGFIPHFQLALNAIMQHFDLPGPTILFKPMHLTGHGTVHQNARFLPAGSFSPRFDPQLRMIQFGTFKTYDWQNGLVLMPYFEGLRPDLFTQLRAGRLLCTHAGIVAEPAEDIASGGNLGRAIPYLEGADSGLVDELVPIVHGRPVVSSWGLKIAASSDRELGN